MRLRHSATSVMRLGSAREVPDAAAQLCVFETLSVLGGSTAKLETLDFLNRSGLADAPTH